MDPMERLMAQMPKMADAVNAFTSPGVQEIALRALLRTFDGGDAADLDDASAVQTEPEPKRRLPAKRSAKKESAANAGEKGRALRASSAATIDKTLDLHPKGKQSFEEFVEAKQPKDNTHDHNVVAVYWLREVAELTNVTVAQVFTCYRDRGWTLPKNLRSRLQHTASEMGWIDTHDADDLTVTPQGINYVESKLPPKPQK